MPKLLKFKDEYRLFSVVWDSVLNQSFEIALRLAARHYCFSGCSEPTFFHSNRSLPCWKQSFLNVPFKQLMPYSIARDCHEKRHSLPNDQSRSKKLHRRQKPWLKANLGQLKMRGSWETKRKQDSTLTTWLPALEASTQKTPYTTR